MVGNLEVIKHMDYISLKKTTPYTTDVLGETKTLPGVLKPFNEREALRMVDTTDTINLLKEPFTAPADQTPWWTQLGQQLKTYGQGLKNVFSIGKGTTYTPPPEGLAPLEQIKWNQKQSEEAKKAQLGIQTGFGTVQTLGESTIPGMALKAIGNLGYKVVGKPSPFLAQQDVIVPDLMKVGINIAGFASDMAILNAFTAPLSVGITSKLSPALKAFHPVAARLIAQVPVSYLKFATRSGLYETTKELADGKFSPIKVLQETAKGGLMGSFFGVTTAVPVTTAGQILGGGLALSGWTAMERLYTNGHLTRDDLPALVMNFGLGMLLASIGAKQTADAYKRAYISDQSNYFTIRQIQTSYRVDEQTAIRMADLINKANALKAAYATESLYAQTVGGKELAKMQKDVVDSTLAKLQVITGDWQPQYLIKDGQIQIIDPNTGRVMVGREFMKPYTNALLTKEGFVVTPNMTQKNIVALQRELPGVQRNPIDFKTLDAKTYFTPEEKLILEQLNLYQGPTPMTPILTAEKPTPIVREMKLNIPTLPETFSKIAPTGMAKISADYPLNLPTAISAISSIQQGQNLQPIQIGEPIMEIVNRLLRVGKKPLPIGARVEPVPEKAIQTILGAVGNLDEAGTELIKVKQNPDGTFTFNEKLPQKRGQKLPELRHITLPPDKALDYVQNVFNRPTYGKEGVKPEQPISKGVEPLAQQPEVKPTPTITPEAQKGVVEAVSKEEQAITAPEEEYFKQLAETMKAETIKGEGKRLFDYIKLSGRLKISPDIAEEMSDIPREIISKEGGLAPDEMAREVNSAGGYNFKDSQELLDAIRAVKTAPTEYKKAPSLAERNIAQVKEYGRKLGLGGKEKKAPLPLSEKIARRKYLDGIKKDIIEGIFKRTRAEHVAELKKEKAPLLGAIEEKMKVLPTIQKGVLDWKPNTLGYNNPYTKVAYRLWDRATKFLEAKTPTWMRTFANKQIAELATERQRVIDGLTQRLTADITKKIEKLPYKIKQDLGMMVNKYIPVSKEYKGLIQNINEEIGTLGKAIVDMNKEWVAKGLMKPEDTFLSEETFLTHLGEYARSYYVRPAKVPGKEPIVIPSIGKGKGVISTSMFKKKMTLMDWGRQSLLYQGISEEEIAAMKNEEIIRYGMEAKKAYGWISQADVMLDRTFKDLISNYGTMQWQDAIVNTPELFSKTPKGSFIPVSDILPRGVNTDRRLGPLNNRYINPALTDEIKNIMLSSRDVLDRVLGVPLSWWKAFKVAGNPATVARNYLSGAIFQTDMAGFPVWAHGPTYIQAVKDYITKDAFYKRARDAGAYGSDYYTAEINDQMLKEMEKSDNPQETFLRRLLDKAGDKIKDSKKIFSYYGTIDHLQRTYLIKVAMKNGATLEQGIHFANKWELDYRFVPKIIEKMRGPIGGWITPFISFYSLMAPRILEVTVARPWIFIKYLILISLLGAYSRKVLNMTKEQEENAKPEFLKGDPYTVLLPYKDENNNPIFLNLTYTLPIGGWQTGFLDIPGIMDMAKGMGLAGGIKAISDNYDSFTQKQIYDPNDLPSVKREKITSYILRFASPGALQHILNIWDATQGKTIGWPYPRNRDLTQVILRAVGVSTYTGGYNEAILKIRTLEQGISDMNYATKRLWEDVGAGKISKQEALDKNKEAQELIQRKQQEIIQIRKSMPSLPKVSLPVTPSGAKALEKVGQGGGYNLPGGGYNLPSGGYSLPEGGYNLP